MVSVVAGARPPGAGALVVAVYVNGAKRRPPSLVAAASR